MQTLMYTATFEAYQLTTVSAKLNNSQSSSMTVTEMGPTIMISGSLPRLPFPIATGSTMMLKTSMASETLSLTTASDRSTVTELMEGSITIGSKTISAYVGVGEG